MKVGPKITEYNISLTGYEVRCIQGEYHYLINVGCSFPDKIKTLLEIINKIDLNNNYKGD